MLLERHHRVLVAAANDGLLLWEALRRVPEGLAAALVDGEAPREALLRYADMLDEVERPLVAVQEGRPLPAPQDADAWFGCHSFDHILARQPWRRGFGEGGAEAAFSAFAQTARPLLARGGDVVLLQSPPKLGERISRILGEDNKAADCVGALAEAEEAFFRDAGSGRWAWDAETLERSFTAAGFRVSLTRLEQSEERLLTERDIAVWFDPARSSWGKFMSERLGEGDFRALADMLREKARQGPVLWKWQSLLLKAMSNGQ
jgi:putative ATPase